MRSNLPLAISGLSCSETNLCWAEVGVVGVPLKSPLLISWSVSKNKLAFPLVVAASCVWCRPEDPWPRTPVLRQLCPTRPWPLQSCWSRGCPRLIPPRPYCTQSGSRGHSVQSPHEALTVCVVVSSHGKNIWIYGRYLVFILVMPLMLAPLNFYLTPSNHSFWRLFTKVKVNTDFL
jgi:hypothetical protein